MSEITKAKFDKAVQIIQSLPKDGPVKPTSDDQLFFYSHYKQATIGDINIPRPGMLDFTGKFKWDAWSSIKGTTAEACYKAYVEKLIELLKGAGDPESLKKVEDLEAA